MNAYERAEMDRIDYFRGLEAFKQEGKMEGKMETAQSMLKDSVPAELIARYTGLALTQVKELIGKS